MLVYFANHSHNQLEKDHYRRVVERMENNSFDVYWPERNTKLDGEGKIRRRQFLLNNFEKIKQAQIVVFVIDGRGLDDEAFLELGMTYALSVSGERKLIVGLQLENRGEMTDSKMGELVMSMFDNLPKTEYDLIDCLKSYLITFKS